MRALSLHEPYATLVSIGAKKIETRSWQTFYHHELLIHASKKWTSAIASDWERCRQILSNEAPSFLGRWPGLGAGGRPATLGRVLAMTRLIFVERMDSAPDALEAHFGTYGPGRFGWRLGHTVSLEEPVSWKGALGLWNVPESLEELVTARLPGLAVVS